MWLKKEVVKPKVVEPKVEVPKKGELVVDKQTEPKERKLDLRLLVL